MYLNEETQFKAILRPFSKPPISDMHISPLMTREKPGGQHRRVIVDLSYPKGRGINAGIDKYSYLGSKFLLTLPSVDHITNKIKKLGRGALLYKIDISRAFRHLKIDPHDLDLLGLQF